MNDTKYFCNHLDKKQLPHARSLYVSLQNVMFNFKLMWVNDESFEFLNEINYSYGVLYGFNQNSQDQIIAKKYLQRSDFIKMLVALVRVIRGKIFNDTIIIQ